MILWQFSVLGFVIVNYVFFGQLKSLNMVEGEFSKEFDIDVIDSNDKLEKDCLLYFNFISVIGSEQYCLYWKCKGYKCLFFLSFNDFLVLKWFFKIIMNL